MNLLTLVSLPYIQKKGGGDNLAISPSVNLIGVFGNLQIIGDLCCGVVRGGVGAAKCPMTYVM